MLIDVTVVRLLLLVPAVTTVLGEHAWRTPGPLDRTLPHVAPEADEHDSGPATIHVSIAPNRVREQNGARAPKGARAPPASSQPVRSRRGPPC
ncbi:hypothetical protein GCM10023084_14760 [Streptomyces lacrimifluminis]|uniref:Uncharacterized protein n=1 Tax=Streptomyces lacrimifluminis TaxID=1500077 RepID=A0A917KNT8_9ACTN|nr:hypothetical protein GCM10012282_11950 [Streptomyces lacrimifluminis]